MKRHLTLKTAIFAAVLCTAQLSQAAVTILDKDEWKFQIGGFVQSDMIVDSTRTLKESPGNEPIPKAGDTSGNGANGRTWFSLRNSRFNFTILPPAVDGWKTKGHMEFDLMGSVPSGGTEASFLSNPTMRMRHAYMSAEKDGWNIIVGQTWNLFGWVPYYVPATVSVAPVSGIVYQRTPQLTAIKTMALSESNKLDAGLSISRPAQRDNQVPNIDLGLRWSNSGRKSGFASPTGELKAEPFSVAISGTARQFVVQPVGGAAGDQSRQIGSAVAVNTMLPLLSGDEKQGNSLTVTGEFSTGKGYGDQYPGWTGGLSTKVSGTGTPTALSLDPGIGGLDSGNSFVLVNLKSWNAQMQYHLPSGSNTFITLGATQLQSDNIASITGGTYNEQNTYFGNVFHDCTKQIRIGVEVSHHTTKYVDGLNGNNNRAQLTAWFRF